MTVEELLSKKDIYHQQSGADYLIRCLNPEHDDRNPSLRVNKITGIFHCFSCGFRGNIFKHFDEKVSIFQIRREALKAKIEKKLSESIGFTKPQNAIDYEGNWRGVPSELYKKFGAFESISPEFIGRIVFPITDVSGRIVAFVGRHTNLMHKPKYLIHPGGVSLPLFPTVMPINGKVILVEGLYDMLNLHTHGLTNAVCSFGTRTVTVDKLMLLKMQGVEGIDIIFDSDEAGQKASETIKELCEKAGLTHRNVELKDGADPGSLSETSILRLKKVLYG